MPTGEQPPWAVGSSWSLRCSRLALGIVMLQKQTVPRHRAAVPGWGPGWSKPATHPEQGQTPGEEPREGYAAASSPVHRPVPAVRGTGPSVVSHRADAAGLFLFQRWRVRSLHESCQSLRASSGSELLGLSLGLLGRAHGRCPPCRRAGEVRGARSGKESGAVQADPPFPTLPPPRGLCPAPCPGCSLLPGSRLQAAAFPERWPRVGDSFPFSFPGGQGDSKDQPVSKSTFAPSVSVRGEPRLRLALGCCWVSDARLQWQKTLTLSFSLLPP